MERTSGSNEIVFEVSRQGVWFALVLIGVGCLFELLLCGEFARETGWFFATIVVAAGLLVATAIAMTHVWRKMSQRICVDDYGISYLPARGPTTFIAWREVGKVEATVFTGNLVISDASGLRQIRVVGVVGFDHLREIILNRTEDVRNRGPAASEFDSNYALRTWCAVMALSLAGMGGYIYVLDKNEPTFAFVLFGVAGLLLFGPMLLTVKIRILPEAVRIEYLGWHRTISFGEVKNIDIANRSGDITGGGVLIETVKGRQFYLAGFRPGQVALYDALRRAWRARDSSSRRLDISASPQIPVTQPSVRAASTQLPAVFYVGNPVWLWPFLTSPSLLAGSIGLIALYERASISTQQLHVLLANVALLVVCQVLLFVWLPWRIVLSENAITFQCVLRRRRTIPYSEIREVTARRMVDTTNPAPYEGVEVRLKDGHVRRFKNLKSNNGTFYDVLRAAYKRNP